jgi:hypothetical protein
MDLETFLNLPKEDVAAIVRARRPQTCVFPNDGTRRWFMLEHSTNIAGDWFSTYADLALRRHIELYRSFFDHGIDTLLAPIFGGDTLKRGDEYMQQIALNGLLQFAVNPECLRFYDEHQVRIRFYGDYRKQLKGIPGADQLVEAFDSISAATRLHDHCRLFFGLFANNATETIAELAIRSFQETGAIPDERRIIELYYGEYVEPASLFIGFEKLCAYDYPLLATGLEDLYFMVAPSSYMGEKQLRAILYDHLFARCTHDPDYQAVSTEDFQWWNNYYTKNREVILGTGTIKAGIWIPNPELTLPE